MPTFKRQDQEQIDKAQDLLESAPDVELGFVKSLFFGRLRLDKIMPYPVQDPAEAQRTDEMLAKVDQVMAQVDPDRIDAEERIPREIIRALGEAGVLGMTVPKDYGGGGFGHTAYCRVLERISRTCASTAVLVGAHQSIGLKALVLMGTEEQKRKYLPALASGEKLAAFCLSEPEVGSDAAGVQTSARLSDDGTHWILNGQKRYATNAAIAGLLTVMARTPVTIDGKTRDKVTAFIVTPDLPGFEIISPNRSKMGVRGSWQGTLCFTDMRVPKDQILGELGKGLKVALSVLNYGRCTLSAGCVGGAKRALELATQRARERKQFGRAIGEFGLIKQKLARIAETTFAMDAMTWLCAGLVDRHEQDVILETAISKLFCSEGLWQISDDLLQIWGGEGYMREHGIERMMRDARINRIVEGTTEVMTAFISLVGMKGVGEELESVVRSARHPIGNFGRLARFAKHGWTDILVGGGKVEVHELLAGEGHTLARLTHSLARSVIRVLGAYREEILDMQLLQQRFANCACDLFAMAAVLSKLHSQLANAGVAGQVTDGHSALPRDLAGDLTIGQAFCHHAAERVTRQLHGLFENQDELVGKVADAVMDIGDK